LKFVPVAERAGSIVVLGEWVIDEACRQIRAWTDFGLSCGPVAVNVSARQFTAGSGIGNFVRSTVRKWNISPAQLEIELTESVLMEVTKQNNESLEQLRKFGVRVAIDDFGTGYSSLNYLTSYPFNRLKIAQELVFGVATELRNATVVRAAVRLADELGIECIAEGIERSEQMEFLIGCGCRLGQGYYFSKPLDTNRMTALLKQKTVRLERKKARLEVIAG
jgi:EAL domain-containing protein (putative c-di-GMP-specific phosphodiesterase class I)